MQMSPDNTFEQWKVERMAFEGMDVAEVQTLAHQLQQEGNEIEAEIRAVNSIIAQLIEVWSGPDAVQFEGWWNQQHRPALHAAADAVTGLGQSALNNAQQQIDASRVI